MATTAKKWYTQVPGWLIGYVAVVAFLFGSAPGAAVWRLMQTHYGAVRGRAKRAASIYGLKQAITAWFAIGFFLQTGPLHNLLGAACLLVMGIEAVILMLILNGLARDGSVLKRAIGGVARALYMVLFVVPPVVIALTPHPWNWLAFALLWYSILTMGAMYGILMGVISLAWFRLTQYAVFIIIIANFVILAVPSLSARFKNTRAKDEVRALLVDNETALVKKDKVNVAKWTPCTVQVKTTVFDTERKVVGMVKPGAIVVINQADTLKADGDKPILVRMCRTTADGSPLITNDKKYIYPNMSNIVIGWSPQPPANEKWQQFEATDYLSNQTDKADLTGQDLADNWQPPPPKANWVGDFNINTTQMAPTGYQIPDPSKNYVVWNEGNELVELYFNTSVGPASFFLNPGESNLSPRTTVGEVMARRFGLDGGPVKIRVGLQEA